MMKMPIMITLLACCGCAKQSDLDVCQAQSVTLKGQLAQAQASLTETKSKLNDAEKRAQEAEDKVVKLLRPAKPFAARLAALLQPGAKLPKPAKELTIQGARLWMIQEEIPDISSVTLGRMPDDDEAWTIGLDGKVSAEDFGAVELKCPPRGQGRYYKILAGPLAGAYLEDQQQNQFYVWSPHFAAAHGPPCLKASVR